MGHQLTKQGLRPCEIKVKAIVDMPFVFAMDRFHTYVYGRHVTIETDHKPLITS